VSGRLAEGLAGALVVQLVEKYGADAYAVIDETLDGMPAVEAAALFYDWSFWGREKQLPPLSKWRRWGYLTGRGFGKTIGISRYLNELVENSPTPILICLIAQDEQSSVDIQVNGPSGLIATSPPWCKAEWEASNLQVVWPNGSRAYVRTPEVPGKIRGLEYHITWASELQSWPVATREEAWSNVLLSTRLGDAQVIWDSTPKKRHPILKKLVADGKMDPATYAVIRGTTYENAAALAVGYIDELEREYGGTTKGREELGGEMLEESENALVKQAWIDGHRRRAPEKLERRIVSVDPAVTSRSGSDRTGIIEAGLGVDGQMYVLSDSSGKHEAHVWGALVLDLYIEGKCDVVLVETNKGGDLVRNNLRAAVLEKNAEEQKKSGEKPSRKLEVVLVGEDEKPRHTEGIVYVKEKHARGPKEDRAQPMSTAYQRGRISHVHGAKLETYEDNLTTWEPGGKTAHGDKSPGDIDAAAHATNELLGLNDNKPDPKGGFPGILKAQAQLTRPGPPTLVLPVFPGGSGGKI
jgi:phage terminase large subunit-like protein